MTETLAAIAYEASLKSLEKQDARLGELRARTGLILGASSLAISFLGRSALGDAPLLVAALALAAFAASVGAAIYVLLPKGNLVFSLKGSALYEELFDFRDDIDEVFRRLSYDLDRFWDKNDQVLGRLVWGVRIAAVALAGEVILLLVSVTGNLS